MSPEGLPGAELVAPGLRDLASTEGGPPDPEHRLYRRLRERDGDGAHASYNALVRCLASFVRAVALRA